MKIKKFLFMLGIIFSMSIVIPTMDVNVGEISKVEAASKIKLSKTKATIYVGKTVQLKVKGTKSKVKWSSSKKSVATVSSKGKVKGKKVGTATITAKVGKKKYKCKVTVKNNYSDQTLEVSQSDIRLTGENNTAKIIVKSKYPCLVNGTISNTNVAACSLMGNQLVITGKAEGTAIITLTENRKSVSTVITVTVDYSDQTIEASQNTIKLTSESNSATVSVNTKYPCTLAYNISNPNVASCSWSGNQLIITGKSEGTTTITITNSLNSASTVITVTVKPIEVTFICVDGQTVSYDRPTNLVRFTDVTYTISKNIMTIKFKATRTGATYNYMFADFKIVSGDTVVKSGPVVGSTSLSDLGLGESAQYSISIPVENGGSYELIFKKR